MKIKIVPMAEGFIPPSRAHYNDAGIDCYALADFDLIPMAAKNFNVKMQEVPSNNALKVPLGFAIYVPDGYMATIRPRSSMNAKGIITQIGTIDSGYHGELQCVLMNCSTTPYHFSRGDRICQLVFEPVTIVEFEQEIEDTRGDGGFGSTGQ